MIRAAIALTCVLSVAGCGAAEAQVLNPEEQITQALVAAPSDKAEGARVLGFAEDGTMVEIRAGSNDLVCQADNPSDERFSVSCYHQSLAAYFARGRALDAEGAPRDQRYSTRFAEMDAGTLETPVMGATQYIFDGVWNAETGMAEGATRWVIYVPGATPETTGLSEQPVEGGPWMMFSGTPGAHIMIVPPQGT